MDPRYQWCLNDQCPSVSLQTCSIHLKAVKYPNMGIILSKLPEMSRYHIFFFVLIEICHEGQKKGDLVCPGSCMAEQQRLKCMPEQGCYPAGHPPPSLEGSQQAQGSSAQKLKDLRIPLQLHRLRIQLCHCSSLDPCCGMGSIPGPRTSTCRGQKTKNKNKKP